MNVQGPLWSNPALRAGSDLLPPVPTQPWAQPFSPGPAGTSPVLASLCLLVLPELRGCPAPFSLPACCVHSYPWRPKHHFLCEIISDPFFHMRRINHPLRKLAFPTRFCHLFCSVLFEPLVLKGSEGWARIILFFVSLHPNAQWHGWKRQVLNICLPHECLWKTTGQDILIKEAGTCSYCHLKRTNNPCSLGLHHYCFGSSFPPSTTKMILCSHAIN